MTAGVADEVLVGSTVATPKSRSRSQWTRPTVVVALLIALAAVVAAFFPQLFTSQLPNVGEITDKLQGPSAAHWFGTDHLGRDVYTRVIYGSELSLKATVVAVSIAFGVGSILGITAGYLGGWVDDVVMRVVDVLLAIPTLLLALAIVASLGFGIMNVAVAVGFASVASFARITRGEAARVRTSPYVEASRLSGGRPVWVLGRHVLPNSIGPALVLSTLELGSAVLAVSALSFLGYGEPPPTPEWGKIVAEGRDYLSTAWWIVVIPSAVIAAVVLSTNRLSRALDAASKGDR
ncbi:ABC transporter permease [Rhodococcus sp. Eu-32]|uniref:ABC transporter permease n=1 Tax=Rhodococcus sp. Eu-32 TaxID=1017319 RepID=UPI000DF1B581|nr:ABC transporter permease [Rhodococcus sp. Eu-32]RRQ29416.1 ABC transporter permease [Rhodococcus sp. Eu-32]